MGRAGDTCFRICKASIGLAARIDRHHYVLRDERMTGAQVFLSVPIVAFFEKKIRKFIFVFLMGCRTNGTGKKQNAANPVFSRKKQETGAKNSQFANFYSEDLFQVAITNQQQIACQHLAKQTLQLA